MTTIRVEVAFALPDVQRVVALELPAGSSLMDAVARSGLLEEFAAQIDRGALVVGVFGRIEKQPAARVLADGERVEIYRPLAVDPKEARRARAKKAQKS